MLLIHILISNICNAILYQVNIYFVLGRIAPNVERSMYKLFDKNQNYNNTYINLIINKNIVC